MNNHRMNAIFVALVANEIILLAEPPQISQHIFSSRANFLASKLNLKVDVAHCPNLEGLSFFKDVGNNYGLRAKHTEIENEHGFVSMAKLSFNDLHGKTIAVLTAELLGSSVEAFSNLLERVAMNSLPLEYLSRFYVEKDLGDICIIGRINDKNGEFVPDYSRLYFVRGPVLCVIRSVSADAHPDLRDLAKEIDKLICEALVCQSECDFARSFDARYEAWKSWVREHPSYSTYTANEPYYELEKLGPRAIPLLVGKIQENPEDFHLAGAVQRLSKRVFDKNEWPHGKMGDSRTAAKMYVEWWEKGRFKTETLFNDLLAEWQKYKSENQMRDSEEVARRITQLGLPVLPYLVSALRQNRELVPIFSSLTDNAVSPTASPEECELWWKESNQLFNAIVVNGASDGED